MDRRVQVTQANLVVALRQLMQRYPWDSISIATVCQEAEISRSTFYSHFSSKDELMQLSLEHLALELKPVDTRRGLESSGTLKFIPGLLRHIETHREILVKNRNSVAVVDIQKNIKRMIDGLVSQEIKQSCYAESVDQDKLIFICGGLLAVIERWTDDNCRDSCDTVLLVVDTQIRETLHGVRS